MNSKCFRALYRTPTVHKYTDDHRLNLGTVILTFINVCTSVPVLFLDYMSDKNGENSSKALSWLRLINPLSHLGEYVERWQPAQLFYSTCVIPSFILAHFGWSTISLWYPGINIPGPAQLSRLLECLTPLYKHNNAVSIFHLSKLYRAS